MSNSPTSLNPPVVQLKPEKLADYSLHDLIFKQGSCNLPGNLAVTLGFHAPPGAGPTPGQTTTGVAQVIPEQSDTAAHQSITAESPLIDTAQRQDITHPVSLQKSLGDIIAARTLTVKTTQSPPSRIPIPGGSESLETHIDSAAGTIGEAVSRMRTSPHDIYLQVLIVSLGTTDVPVRETNHATEEHGPTPTHEQSIDEDGDRVRTTEERIYGVGVTAAVGQPTTQSARQARLSPDRTAANVLAPFGTKRSETGFITVAREPAHVRERLENPDTRAFGTGMWSVIQASKIAPTEMLQRYFSLSGRPGMPRVCESDLGWFIGGAR